MKKKPTAQNYAADRDNVELLDLMGRLDGHGMTQRDIADLLAITPGQLSHIKKGERHASRKHVRTLRAHLRRLTLDRKVREINSAPSPSAISVFELDGAVLNRLSPEAAVAAFRDLLWARAAELGVPTTKVSISSDIFTADGGVDASVLDADAPAIDGDALLTSGTRYQIKTGDFQPWQRARVERELFGRNNPAEFQNLGAAIQRTLREKKRLVFVCFGVDPVDEKLRKARENLASAFEACGYAPSGAAFTRGPGAGRPAIIFAYFAIRHMSGSQEKRTRPLSAGSRNISTNCLRTSSGRKLRKSEGCNRRIGLGILPASVWHADARALQNSAPSFLVIPAREHVVRMAAGES